MELFLHSNAAGWRTLLKFTHDPLQNECGVLHIFARETQSILALCLS